MKYVSTRGMIEESVSSAYAIKTGLASDGGLFMPESIPTLTKKEISDMTGIYRTTYVHYEKQEQKLYDINYLQKIADIYKIDITCLLDDYMMFMYKGQGKQIKALRKALGLTQDKLANMLNTPKSNIKHWEQERCFMQYDNFIKIKEFFDI